jgi:hypothetical protein
MTNGSGPHGKRRAGKKKAATGTGITAKRPRTAKSLAGKTLAAGLPKTPRGKD